MTRPSSISSSLSFILIVLIITQPSVSSVEERSSGFLLAFCDVKGSRVQFSDHRSDWNNKSAITDEILRANSETSNQLNENYHDFSRKLFDQVSICCSITVLNTFQLTYEVQSWLAEKCSPLPLGDSLDIIITLRALPRIWSWTVYSSQNHTNDTVDDDDEHLSDRSTTRVNLPHNLTITRSVNKEEDNVTATTASSVQFASAIGVTEYTCVQSTSTPGEVAICSFDHKQDNSSSLTTGSSGPPRPGRLSKSGRRLHHHQRDLTASLSSIDHLTTSHVRDKRDHPHRHHNRDPSLRLSSRKHHTSSEHDQHDHRNRYLLLHGTLVKIDCPRSSPLRDTITRQMKLNDSNDQISVSTTPYEYSHDDKWTHVHFASKKNITFKFQFAPVMAIKGKTFITIKRNDQLLRLNCRVYGSPLPQMHWLKDSQYLAGDRVDDDTVHQLYNDSLSYSISREVKSNCSMRSTLTLTIKSVKDLGSYHCIAQNKHGKVAASYRIKAESSRVFTQSKKFNFTGFLIGMIPPIVVSIFFILKLGYRSRYASAVEDESLEQEMYTENNLNLFT